MPTIATKAGPWNMTVFAFDEDDPQNPLSNLSQQDIARLPYGAAELDSAGKVVSYNDTEPDCASGPAITMVGQDFFVQVAPRWASGLVAEEFHKGIQSGALNAVFDCAAPGLTYKVRLHLKISPILGTFWIFIKKLHRSAEC